MKNLLYKIFNKDVVAGDDGVATMREVAMAWFVVLSLLLTLCGIPLAITGKLTGDYIQLLIICYSMTVTLMGISTGKSSFNRFVEAKYSKKGDEGMG